MAEHENAALVRGAYEAFSSGDLEKLNDFIAEDCVWHVTGNSILSGDYEGRDAIYGYLGKLMELSGGTFQAVPSRILADDSYAVAIQQSTGTINGRDVSTTDILVNRIENGQGVEVWVYLEDDTVYG